jgi:two-component system chemotaxis response regulator CheB
MRLVIIGSSTGGPYILEQIFTQFPVIPAVIIIVQHLPQNFTDTFCKHLGMLARMQVRIATHLYQFHEGEILIAPAGKHLVLSNNRSIMLQDGDKLHGVKPAADYAMLSLHQREEDHLAGVVLTGMGQDGAVGIAHIKKLGGHTIAQDPTTSPIKSMPQAAIETGKITDVLSPAEITMALIQFGLDKN